MKSSKNIGIFVLSAFAVLALAGCGKGKGNANQNPNPYPQYSPVPWQNQQVNQPYNCPNGFIQLRNSFGNSQCYNTQDLGQACQQAGGYLAQGNLCRRERQVQGSYEGTLRNNNGYYPSTVSLRAGLYAGESFKLMGNLDALSDAAYTWDAELMHQQSGSILGSASSGGYSPSSGYNLVIASMGNTYSPYGYNQQYNQPYNQHHNQPYNQPYNPQYNPQIPQNAVCIQAPCPQNTSVYPGQWNQWNQPGYSMQNQPMMNQYLLRIRFRGKLRVKLYGAAISCEDGRGNSYACQ